MSVVAFQKPAETSEPVAAPTPTAVALHNVEQVDDIEFGLKRPIVIGSSIFAVFIVGMGLLAAFAPLSSAVIAPGVVRVEDNRKVVKHRDGGIVSQVLVRDGERVDAGQTLLRMDEVQARSAFEVYDNQYMSLLARRARFVAESSGFEEVIFPNALTERVGDERVQALMADQTALFVRRRQGLQSQTHILEQRLMQLDTRISGYEQQLNSIARQRELIEEEKAGVESLADRGYAPRTQVLALERAAVSLGGQVGALSSQIAEAGELKGETQMQISRIRDERLTEGSQGLSEVQTELSNTLPRLIAAKATLSLTEVKSPVAGTVLGLTQFTEGGVVGAGERILDIVPDDTQLIVQATIRPNDIAEIAAGMAAQVKLTAYLQSVTPSVDGEIIRVSADRITDEDGGAYYTADVRINPQSLSRSMRELRLYPGMPAEVIVATGNRTALDYLVSPISNSLDRAFREQ